MIKKSFLLSKICFVVLCLMFCSFIVYAAEDSFNKTINVQGKLTTDSGQPITGTTNVTLYIYSDSSGSGGESWSKNNVNVDSDGIYNADIEIGNVSFKDQKYFKVKAGNVESAITPFAASPNAFYASTATYALSLDPNGEKLKSGNFDSEEYTINVTNAMYVSTQTASGKNGYVWGITDDNGTQAWVKPGDIQIHEATTEIVGGILLGNDTGLVMEDDGKTLKINNGDGLKIDNDQNKNQLAIDFGSIENNSTKAVTGGDIYTALLDKQDKVAAGTQYNIVAYSGTEGTVDTLTRTTSVRAATNASDTAIATEKAVRTELDKKQDLISNPSTSSNNKISLNSNTEKNYIWGYNGNKQGWFKLADSDGKTVISGADLAEIYQSTEKLVPGDVVSIDTTKDNAIVKTKVAEDTLVAGVISTEPGVLMNQKEKGYKLALVGKVPTKVCNEGGAIKRGYVLVASSIP